MEPDVTAKHLVIESARAGSAEDQLALGMHYLQGEQAEYQEAAYWLEQASRNGNEVARFQLALLAASGRGLRKDLHKAAEHFEKCQSSAEFEQIATTYEKEVDELKALLSAVETEQKWNPFKVKSPAMKRRLRELTRKERRVLDRAWGWAMFIHVATAALVVEVALSIHLPERPQTLQIELGSVEQVQPQPEESLSAVVPPQVPPSTKQQPVVRREPLVPTQLTSAIPSAPSDASQSKSTEADTGVGGASGSPEQLEYEMAEVNRELFGGQSTSNSSGTFDGRRHGWGSGDGQGTATGNGASMFGKGLGRGGAVLCRDLFAKHDLAVIIDKSGSMGTADCPDGRTRWEWCRDQTADLARMAAEYGSDYGPNITVFSDSFTTYHNTRLDAIFDIFRTNAPYGSTRTAEALQNQLDEYFTIRGKPLVIAVITDGVPADQRAVCETIIAATKQLNSPKEVKITFLQIGEDPIGYTFAWELDHHLVNLGARYDIVSSKSFDELKRTGVIGALLDVVAGDRKLDRVGDVYPETRDN